MQGSISADSFGCYRLELAIDLTEEEGDRVVHQLAGLGDRAESPLGLEYWERDGDVRNVLNIPLFSSNFS